MIDLHTHSTASDGTLSPEKLVAEAKALGLKAVAITDHDTVDGVKEGLKAGQKLGIQVIPGVEISLDHRGREMHILGYFIQIDNPALQKGLSELQLFRRERNPRIITRLQEAGVKVTLAEVEVLAGGSLLGRPHFASFLVAKGYAESIQEAFDKYLAKGGLAYEPKEKLVPRAGIELIKRAGGIPVLAHPKYLQEQGPELKILLTELKKFGLQGLEAYYTTHTPEETQTYLDLARDCQLLVTGGSDFHGANKPETQLGTGYGSLVIEDNLLVELMQSQV